VGYYFKRKSTDWKSPRVPPPQRRVEKVFTKLSIGCGPGEEKKKRTGGCDVVGRTGGGRKTMHFGGPHHKGDGKAAGN